MTFPHEEVILATTSFIDIGPPFDYYTLYLLSKTTSGTDVERISVTPAASTCALPTTEVKQTHIEDSLSRLFNEKDPCLISQKASRRESKRCKHCLVFSGIHANVQLTCGVTTRVIRYEVLDRDLFDAHPNTPNSTSHTLALIEKLNGAFGGGDFDRPIFPTDNSERTQVEPGEDITVRALSNGEYDNLFGESISSLYKDSLQRPKLPLVEIVDSSALPISPVLPHYPPIARAAHIGGTISMRLKVSPQGRVSSIDNTSGPEMLRGVTTTSARAWSFAESSAEHEETVNVNFNLNCPAFSTSSSSAIPAAPSAH